MARISREFLVPYIQNLCSLHLVQEKNKKRISQLKWEINQVTNGERREVRPKPPGERTVFGFTEFSVAFVTGLFGLAVLWIGGWEPNFELFEVVTTLLLIAAIGMFIVCLCVLIAKIRENSAYNHRELARYQEESRAWRYAKEQNEEARQKKLPGLQAALADVQAEYNRVETVLRQMYAANIIPMKYRDLYTTVYLYDWFVNGVSSDLDMALNTFVLEEIKDKLDVIIRNQEEIILNQRRQMAMQQQSLETQEQHYRMMEQKAAQIAQSQEEQVMYLNMIESNTSATAYFAAANFWWKR